MAAEEDLPSAHAGKEIPELLDQVFGKFGVDSRLVKSYLGVLSPVAAPIVLRLHSGSDY
jgi:hypothetical protein